ncbi:MAG: PKD domain-containing protein [Coleofasciculaceae cyanobacterium]
MTSCLLQSIRIFGATVFLLTTATISSQATTLTGFQTNGNNMSGIQVRASFLNGASETITWIPTNNISGGAFGSSWSLTQSGDTFSYAWSLSNTGVGITSLVIDAIPGNTVFDTYPLLEGPLQTPGSAEGWEFVTLPGEGPNSYAYSDPIDISQGDLFGTLSLYWSSGFVGDMIFGADTDSGSNNDPVQPQNPLISNSPPTVSFSAPTINEGQLASATLSATDPGADAITFFLDGNLIGTNYQLSGIRSLSTSLGLFADNGEHLYTALARDEDGNYSNPVTGTLTVLNVAPTLTAFNLSSNTINEGESVSASLSATDPGADGQTFFINNNQVGSSPQTSGTRIANSSLGLFLDEGTFTFTGQSQDKDGDYSNQLIQTLTVLNVAPTLTQLTEDLTVTIDELFNFSAAATDPGVNDLLSFDWDFDMDGLFDDFSGAGGEWLFAEEGTYEVGVRVSDGDGGFDFGSLTVAAIAPEPTDIEPETVPGDDGVDFGSLPAATITPEPTDIQPETVPEPNVVLSLLGLTALAAGFRKGN